MLYENGVDKLLSLSKNISELYRELNEMTRILTDCNRESVKFDRLYVKELLWKKEDVIEKYDQLLVQLCINECFDLKVSLQANISIHMKKWRTSFYNLMRSIMLQY